MANYPYRDLGIMLDLDNWQALNDNFADVATDVQNVQAQVNQLVVTGDSSPEASQARVSVDGEVYATLKDRLDSEYLLPTNRFIENTIPSSKLRIVSDADRIKLVNLSDEVLQAMVGTTPINVTPAVNSVTKEKVVDGAITPQKTDFLKVGKNILNDATAFANVLLTTDGTTPPLSGYRTSDFIAVDPSKTYTISYGRAYHQYTASKVAISGAFVNTGNNDSISTFTTSATAAYVRVSYSNANATRVQLEKGGVATSYESFTPYVNFEAMRLTSPQITQVLDNIVLPVDDTLPIKVTKSGESFALESKFDSTQNIVISTTRNGSSNGSFNFNSTTVGGSVIHTNADDITPIRTFSTVGANHGYTSIVRVTMSGHGKTTADLGSRWTDGTTQYTLLDIIGNDLVFGCPYTVSNDIVGSTRIAPTGNLTHVSGATNTTTVSTTTVASSSQLYPSINKISVKYVLDGKEITDDGIYFGNALEVQESYNIMDYKAIIDFAQANIGISYKNDSIAGIVTLTNRFVFTRGLKCTTSHGLSTLKKVSLGECGFLQSSVMSLSGHTRKRFMPGVLPKEGWDFEAGVDLDAYNVSLLYTSADNKVAGIPPSHYTDWLYQTGVRKFGFTMGYIVDKTNSKHADRLANTPTLWDMRSSKKAYPVALRGTLEAGEYRSFMGFRNYLSPEEVGSATTLNVVEDAKDTYLYAHLNAPAANLSKKINGHIGEGITALQNDGITVKNEIVDASGVVVSAAGAVSNAIIKLA